MTNVGTIQEQSSVEVKLGIHTIGTIDEAFLEELDEINQEIIQLQNKQRESYETVRLQMNSDTKGRKITETSPTSLA